MRNDCETWAVIQQWMTALQHMRAEEEEGILLMEVLFEQVRGNDDFCEKSLFCL